MEAERDVVGQLRASQFRDAGFRCKSREAQVVGRLALGFPINFPSH